MGTQWLDEHGLPYGSAAAHAAALIVGELAANAVRHCGGTGRDFRLRLELSAAAPGSVLRLEVTDTRADKPLPPGGCRPVPPTAADEAEESGRGLLLVDAYADRWGSRANDPITKTLWAEIDLPVPPSPGAQGRGSAARTRWTSP